MKRKNTITSESITKWHIVYKPEGTAMVTQAHLSTRFTTSGKDNEWLGRWSFMAIEGKQDTKLSIINAYCPCDNNSNTGVSKTITQQWDILEERGIEEINARQKMINDLSTFINFIQNEIHQVILLIDANESTHSKSGGITTLLDKIKMIDACTNNVKICKRKIQKYFFCGRCKYIEKNNQDL